jgi:hypothetical protein
MIGSAVGANDVNLAGLAMAVLFTLFALVNGFVIVRDWRGWGTRDL